MLFCACWLSYIQVIKLYFTNESCVVLVNPFLSVIFFLFSICVSVATLGWVFEKSAVCPPRLCPLHLSRFDFVGQGFLSLEFPISLSSFFRCFYAFLYLSSIFFLPVNFYMCFFSCSFMFCLTNSNRIESNLDLCRPRLVLYFLIRQHCVSVSRSMLHIL